MKLKLSNIGLNIEPSLTLDISAKAKSMKKKQNNRRKKGWIDLEGIRKRRTYN